MRLLNVSEQMGHAKDLVAKNRGMEGGIDMTTPCCPLAGDVSQRGIHRSLGVADPGTANVLAQLWSAVDQKKMVARGLGGVKEVGDGPKDHGRVRGEKC